MEIKKIKELIQAVKTDPKAQETLKDLVKPADEDGIVRYYAEAAKLLGFDVTEADIRETIADAARKRTDKTEEAAQSVKALGDDGLEKVSGGTDTCKFLYEQRQNCVIYDACDQHYYDYDNYECRNNYAGHQCGNSETLNCEMWFF